MSRFGISNLLFPVLLGCLVSLGRLEAQDGVASPADASEASPSEPTPADAGPPPEENASGGDSAADQQSGDATGGDAESADDKREEDPSDAAELNPGQADLDEAVLNRIDANTPEQLDGVIELLESAMQQGLDAENTTFARKMLGSALLQKSEGLAAAMMRARGRRRVQLRDQMLDGLEQAVENDPTLVEAYLLIARMNLLPGGDRGAIVEATSKAIDLLKDDPLEQSAALVLRALHQEDEAKQMEDLNAAAKADPSNIEAFQARAALRFKQQDIEGAVSDLEVVLLKDPTNEAVARAASRNLVELDRLDEAVDLTTKLLEAKPSEGMLRLRSTLHRIQGKYDDALSDLNKALAMQPKDPISLIERSELSLARGDIKSAKEDFRTALELAPQLINADRTIAIRSSIAMQENRLPDAINDIKLLVERNPDDLERQIQLANLYTIDNRPRKAIETLSAALANDPKNARVLRSRADALLSVGDHPAAVADYEQALQALGNIEMIDSEAGEMDQAVGIYNNLSWVLATSPIESVRDGRRALEYGEKAAKLSDYNLPHILSTLAAAYAESGDFDKAVEWSNKAVEIGRDQDHDQIEQLEEELESYKQGKPWREQQQTEENSVPILSPDDLIDA